MRIDMTGKPCPLPVIEAKQAIRALGEEGGEIQVLVDNEIAVQNLEKMARGMGHVAARREEEGNYLVSIRVVSAADAPAGGGQGLVVAIGSRRMGQGAEELGATLMKNYLYALTELEEKPAQLLFFNEGAYLTCDGSEALEDLRTLAAAGTKVNTCGACLNFYGLLEQLAIGEVTNMYAIAETMANAGKLVQL